MPGTTTAALQEQWQQSHGRNNSHITMAETTATSPWQEQKQHHIRNNNNMKRGKTTTAQEGKGGTSFGGSGTQLVGAGTHLNGGAQPTCLGQEGPT
jgi:hypothetical protein